MAAISLGLACVTVQRGPLGHPVDEGGHPVAAPLVFAGLKVSAEEISALASPALGVVEVTFENTSASWIRIRSLALDFGGPTSGVEIPGGADLEAWRQATLQRLALFGEAADDHALLALGASVGGPHAEVRAIAAVASSEPGGATAYPDYHLLSFPIVIPPGLFTKRWVVLATGPRAPCVRGMVMSYDRDDDRHQRLALALRTSSASEWQHLACSRP